MKCNKRNFIKILSALSFIPAKSYSSGFNSISETSNPAAISPTQLIGKIRPRSACEIKGSLLSIGAETMDRDFTIYNNWKSYLGSLGFKKARILSGWAKTEPAPKQYEWEWMDNIVNDMVQQCVTPWVTLCYGNPHYSTFKDDSRGDPPRTEEAYKAWESYILAYVTRYKDKIYEYEIWNEPRHGKKISPEDYSTLVIRTTKVIKSVQPDALINILALDHAHFEASVGVIESDKKISEYATKVFQILKDENFINQINAVTYHPYTWNPDDSYDAVNRFQKLVKEYGTNLKIIQGENGAPSQLNTKRALNNYPWTELSQAKYGLRRLIADLAHDIPTSYFSIADMFYSDEVNNKALLKARPDKTIERPKMAYFALQNLSSIFDEQLSSVADMTVNMNATRKTSAYQFKDKNKNVVIAFWLSGKIPTNDDEHINTEIKIKGCMFDNPVYVDMISGKVFGINKKNFIKKSRSVEFKNIMIPDYPILIAERSVLEII